MLAASAAFAQAPTIGSCTVFPADNVWNTPIDQLPVAANSATYVATIGAGTGVHADFGAGLWDGGPIGIPFVTVPGTQTKYPATFQYASESDPGPYAVPLNAPIEGGSASTGDRHAISVDVNNCILYELYYAFPQASSWQAGSGAIYNLLTNGPLRPAGWTSADAAGLPIFPGLMRYDEVAAGEIRHAIRFTVPQTLKQYIWPARHYASSLTDPKYPPMGLRFRLKAGFDVSSFSAQNQVILRALKKYGMILADNGSAWYISGAPDDRWDNSALHDLGRVIGSDFEAVDESSLMIDPNSGQARQNGISVTVSPATWSMLQGTTKQFTATVLNSNQGVSWSVNGVPGGSAATGTTDQNGFYIAPASPPVPATVTLRATSIENSAVSGSAAVTITAPVVVSVTVKPTTASVRTGRTVQFTATVSGSSNKSVSWTVNGVAGGNSTVGTISVAGLYRAPSSVPSPATVTVKAVSAADPTASASASVTITRH
jgi:hypothetical protein